MVYDCVDFKSGLYLLMPRLCQHCLKMSPWPALSLLYTALAVASAQSSDPLYCNKTTIANCSRSTVLNATCGSFSTPNYPNADYPINTGCIWQLIVPQNQRVIISFDHFELDDCSEKCNCDNVEVRDGLTGGSPVMGLYCGKSKPQPILTHGNTAWIKFKSDSVFTSKGFKARFKAYETPKTKLTTCPLSNRYNPVCPWLGDDSDKYTCCYAGGPTCCRPGGTNCTDEHAITRNYCPRPWEPKEHQLCCDVKGKAACCKPYKEVSLFSGTQILALSVASVLVIFTAMIVVFCCCCKNCSKPMGA